MNIGGINNNTINIHTSNKKPNTDNDIFTINSAVKKTNSSNNGKKIGLTLVGNQAYIATYADSSTPSNPIVKVGDYEISINDVNPENATEIEMFALMSYLDDTKQTNNKGICSFGKMKAFSDFAEMCGFCSGINDANSIYNQKQNWLYIINKIKGVFLENSQTYNQALECDILIDTMKRNCKNNCDNMFYTYNQIN